MLRRLLLAAVAAAVIGGIGLHSAGYAVLIASGSEGAAESGPTANGMARLRCIYFTGTEKVITHILRKAEDGAPRAACPLTRKLAQN